MNKEEVEGILDMVTPNCFICGEYVDRDEMSLETSVQLLKKHPDHVGPEFTQYYMVCPECKDRGELI